jgi:nucleoside-diphosphate-sugar epimerase
MKWLVYGSKGWIGGMVSNALTQQNETVVEASARADNEHEVESEIISVRPDRILCFIGRTHGPGYSTIDYLEQKGKLVENVRDNLYSPLVLAILGKKHSIHVTYLGTGCIFSNTNGESAFTEESLPNFFGSGYSTVKGFTDRLMRFFSDSTLNLRIRMPIVGYHHSRNFITKITSYERICSIPNSMTVLPDMIPIIIDMATRNVTGTVNLTNPGTISHNEILDLYKKYVDPAFTWKNFTLEEQSKILLSGRSNNELDATRLRALYPNVPSIHDSVEHLLQSWVTDANTNCPKPPHHESSAT